jgi:hypothetical protein
MKKILDHTLEYLKKTIPEFKQNSKGFTCPSCKTNPPTCNFVSQYHYTMGCVSCDFSGDLTDLLNPDKEVALKMIRDTLDLKVYTNSELDELFSFYMENGFDLVPIQKNGKIPIEKDWTNKIHKNPEEWKMFLERGSNLGVKTGQCSNITVIDIDNPDLVKDFRHLLTPTAFQSTNKGFHHFYLYEEDLPKTRLEKYAIDIENNGGQVVIEPSIVEDISRKITKNPIVKMSPELKQWLVTQTGGVKTSININSQPQVEDINLVTIPEGMRHHILMKIGGVLRKELNGVQLDFVLGVLNTLACKPQLDKKEFTDIVQSLIKYDGFDEKDLAKTILRYISIVEECTSRDIKEALGFRKDRIDKVLSYLLKEERIIKKNRMYHFLKKAEWNDTWLQESQELKYKIPYLYDVGRVRNGDLILIGGKSGTGKTHVAINIIKGLVDQGVMPYYISLESGSRFSIIAQELGLLESQFKWCTHFSPENIELEPNAITILDWLLPRDYASTDKTYEHFAKQLVKQGGILIVFCQLRRDGTFFAEDMIKFFPSIIAKFLYDDETNGERSAFEIVKIREPFDNRQGYKIPCIYDWQSKRLRRVEEVGK